MHVLACLLFSIVSNKSKTWGCVATGQLGVLNASPILFRAPICHVEIEYMKFGQVKLLPILQLKFRQKACNYLISPRKFHTLPQVPQLFPGLLGVVIELLQLLVLRSQLLHELPQHLLLHRMLLCTKLRWWVGIVSRHEVFKVWVGLVDHRNRLSQTIVGGRSGGHVGLDPP